MIGFVINKTSAICCLLLTHFISGCAGNPYQDAVVDIPPLASGEAISIEMESGNMICVTERNDPSTRTCVPRVNVGEAEQGE